MKNFFVITNVNKDTKMRTAGEMLQYAKKNQKADLKQNGSKLVSTLLERCVLSIGSLTRKDVGTEEWRDIIRGLYVGDQDYMLIKLRELSMGGELEVNHTCPNCKENLKTYLDVSELETDIETLKTNVSNLQSADATAMDSIGRLMTADENLQSQIDNLGGVLADLGVSFHHFDEAERGFSFRFDGPLDMRMNRKSKLTAEILLNEYEEQRLADIFY